MLLCRPPSESDLTNCFFFFFKLAAIFPILVVAWVRGAAADFDRWRDALGVAGWGARDVEPAYRRAERCFYPEGSGEEEEPLATGRGASGTVPIRMRQPSLRTASARFLAAVEAKGVAPLVEDYNVWPGGMPGAGHTQANIGEGGGRQATATTYLGRALRRERAANLRVLTRAHVGRVLFDKSSGDRGEPRATGVEFYAEALGANAPLVARLAEGGEVVLSAGAVGTPLILQRSGVGPRELLEPLGIDVVVANANVGANLQDHIFTPLAVLTNTSTLGNHAITPGAIGEYARGATGPLASDLIEVMAFVDLGTHNETRGAPDIQFHFVPSRADPIYCSAMGFNGTWCDEMVKADAAGVDSYLLLPTLLHPRSTGTINITAADPLAPPAIDANYLSDQRDVRALVRGLQLAADMIASSPLREISTGLMNCVNWPQSFVDKTGLTSPESSPNWNLPNASDEEFWEEYVRTFSLTVYHPTSTCAMGAAEGDSCALPDLRVRGTRGLRVADASAMPDIVSGNTNAACIMIGERVAELMLKDDN